MVPRKFPCKGITYNAEKPDDPYHKNPPITADFYDLTSWKNGRNGAIAKRVGDIRFHNFRCADNIKAGIEFSQTAEFGDEMASINNAVVFGKTSNTDETLEAAAPHGIITPRTERFNVNGVKFYNYNWGNAAAIGSCSHCFHPVPTDSGARTVTF